MVREFLGNAETPAEKPTHDIDYPAHTLELP
jgi:hypothetical protein